MTSRRVVQLSLCPIMREYRSNHLDNVASSCSVVARISLRVGHSLWLIPREPARSRIQNIIDHHSSDKGTVNFRAHVTLIAGVEPEGGAEEVLAKAESLALKLQPIPARVERTGCMDLYFKSVSILVLLFISAEYAQFLSVFGVSGRCPVIATCEYRRRHRGLYLQFTRWLMCLGANKRRAQRPPGL